MFGKYIPLNNISIAIYRYRQFSNIHSFYLPNFTNRKLPLVEMTVQLRNYGGTKELASMIYRKVPATTK